VLEDVLVLPFNDQPGVERLLEQHGAGVAAVILDPVSQRPGFPDVDPGFYAFLRDITRAYGMLLIYDEVISFRVGYHGAQGIYGGDPDLTTLGKIMGGGLPVGAVGGRAEVMELLDPTDAPAPIQSGGTFSANPLTMTAGVAAMSLLTPDVFTRLNALGEQLRARGTAVFSDLGQPGQLTGDASLFRIVLTSAPLRTYRDLVQTQAPEARAQRLHRLLLDEGIIVGTNLLGCLSTPMGEAEVDAFVAGLRRAVGRLVSEN
jgi:glutamate-1-semialdehyde 2,1-aminomutase